MRQENLNHIVFSSALPTSLVSTPPLRPGLLLFRGILALAFAATVLLFPAASLLGLSVWAGAYFVADGATALFLRTRSTGWTSHRWPIFSGLLGIAIGAFMLWQPAAAALALSLITGAWALFLGALALSASLHLRNDPNVSGGGRLLVALSGLAAAGLGAGALFRPELGAYALLGGIALSAALLGVASLTLSFQMRRCRQNGECTMNFSRDVANTGDRAA